VKSLQMILGAIETVFRIFAHRALENLSLFPVHLLANNVPESRSDSRIGIDKIDNFSDVRVSRDLHTFLQARSFDCAMLRFGCFATGMVQMASVI
jgi:hypothetical protein